MKRFVTFLLALAIGSTCGVSLAACSSGDDQKAAEDLAAKVESAQKLTTEQLVDLAKEETGNFVAYGNTSRITTAMENFIEAYGTKLGLSSSNATASKQSDSNIYTLLANESVSVDKSKNASMVLIQDSATLAQYRESTTMLTNYIPYGCADVVDEDNLVPLAHQFINKLFIYNTAGDTTAKFTNVWQLTESAYEDKIFFKSPTSEQVNMNFLIMLTNEEWSGKLQTAYKTYFNKDADDVGEGKTYENYGYKWVKEFLDNCNFSINSDTTIAQNLSAAENAGKMGLFVLSKLRDKSVTSENLQVSAWDKEGENFVKIEPFAGFMYSIYAQLATNGPRPYTAMLFINYLMTSEGFTPWGGSLGGYSANTTVPVYEGDQSLSFWKDTLVFENGTYIKSVKSKVEDIINKWIA